MIKSLLNGRLWKFDPGKPLTLCRFYGGGKMKFINRQITVIAWVMLLGAITLTADRQIDPVLWQKALKIHERALVVDTHVDTPMYILGEKTDLGRPGNPNDVDFVRMKEGGLDAVFFAVFVSNRLDKKQPSKNALDMIDEVYLQIENNPGLAELAVSPGDMEHIHQKGKRAILLGLENGGPLEGNLRLLRNYYRLGVRYITLTHSAHNDICDSCSGGTAKWNGLSPFGKTLVQEMNRLGMLIDVSHISDRAFWDVLSVSKAPVFASHSCVRSLCDVSRNMSDKMIKALAKKGGVIQINFFSAFLDEDYRKRSALVDKEIAPQRKLLREKYKNDRNEYWNRSIALWKKHAPEPPSIDRLIDHIDYVVKLVGVDYVGLGSDYDGASSYPGGLADVTGYPLITYHLLKRGYEEKDIIKILGGNFLRFFRQAEGVSRQLKSASNTMQE